MKRHFKPEDRTLAYQVFYFIKAKTYIELLENIDDIDKASIDESWRDFTIEFNDFIKSDYNRDDFDFTDCVNGYLEEKLYNNKDYE